MFADGGPGERDLEDSGLAEAIWLEVRRPKANTRPPNIVPQEGRVGSTMGWPRECAVMKSKEKSVPRRWQWSDLSNVPEVKWGADGEFTVAT